jgi:hypothetical protein
MRAGVRRGQDASVQPLDQATAIGALITAYGSLTAVAAGLTAADRAQLGAAADRYPLFG